MQWILPSYTAPHFLLPDTAVLGRKASTHCVRGASLPLCSPVSGGQSEGLLRRSGTPA